MIGSGNVNQNLLHEKKTELTDAEIEVSNRNNDKANKENLNSDVGFYIQSYTCETGKIAKFIIPEDATKDDLLAFSDMLGIVLRRKYKIHINE